MDTNFSEGRKKALEFGRRLHNAAVMSAKEAQYDEIERLVNVGYTKEEAKEHLRVAERETMERNGYGVSKRSYAFHQIGGDLQRKPIMGGRYMAC